MINLSGRGLAYLCQFLAVVALVWLGAIDESWGPALIVAALLVVAGVIVWVVEAVIAWVLAGD